MGLLEEEGENAERGKGGRSVVREESKEGRGRGEERENLPTLLLNQEKNSVFKMWMDCAMKN